MQARGALFAVDFAPQLGDVAFLVDEARGGTVGSEVEFAVGFPVSEKAKREFTALDRREIKLLVITGVLPAAIGVELREQEGAWTRLYVLARAGLEDLHAPGGCLLARAVLLVGHGGLAYELLDVLERRRGGRMGVGGKPISPQSTIESRFIFLAVSERRCRRGLPTEIGQGNTQHNTIRSPASSPPSWGAIKL